MRLMPASASIHLLQRAAYFFLFSPVAKTATVEEGEEVLPYSCCSLCSRACCSCMSAGSSSRNSKGPGDRSWKGQGQNWGHFPVPQFRGHQSPKKTQRHTAPKKT